MPKQRVAINKEHKRNNSPKCRIGTRDSGKPALQMSTAALLKLLDSGSVRGRDAAKIRRVLDSRS